MSCSAGESALNCTGVWLRNTAPSARIETVSGSFWSCIAPASVFGSCSGTPTVSSGAEIMKMISSTSITSTSGVTLISDSALRRALRPRRPAW